MNRRGMLKGVLGGAAAVVVAPSLSTKAEATPEATPEVFTVRMCVDEMEWHKQSLSQYRETLRRLGELCASCDTWSITNLHNKYASAFTFTGTKEATDACRKFLEAYGGTEDC